MLKESSSGFLIIFAFDHLNKQIQVIKGNRILRLIIISFTLLLSVSLEASSLENFLEELDVRDIKVLKKESFYSQIYEVMFEQPLDHNDPSKGSFFQKLYISHYDPDKPVVLVTAGYGAGYYYTSEPALLLECNQILAEHRYFGKSTPDSIDYSYLTAYQSASDHHRIIEAFSSYYDKDWITTGISKGGQTTLMHSYYYPEDATLRIPYVAPLNKSIEDERVYEFLDQVGSVSCRKKIYQFQKNALKNKEKIIPEFIAYSKAKNYTYDLLGGMEKAYEYCVLEYSFAFWQWGYSSCSDIPGPCAEPKEIVRHMNIVAGFDYFADKFAIEYQPFYYQSYAELGYYGYDLETFGEYLDYADDPGFRYALPRDMEINFKPDLLQNLDSYVKKDAEKFIFIYGEYDTWSATAVEADENENIRIFFKPKGSHRTRIRNMSDERQAEILTLMQEWLSN